MSNDNVFERLYKQQCAIGKMVLDGKRKPEYVAAALQRIMEGLPCGPIRSNTFRFTMGPIKPESFGEGCTYWRGPLEGDGLQGKELIDRRLPDLHEIDLADVRIMKSPDYTGHLKLEAAQLIKDRIQLGGSAAISFYYDFLLNREDSHLSKFRKESDFDQLEFFGLILRDSKGLPSVICLDFKEESLGVCLNPLDNVRSERCCAIEVKCKEVGMGINPT